MDGECSACRFYAAHSEQCRRYAPRMLYPKKKWLDIQAVEMLRDIAWSQRTLAGIETDKDDIEDDINMEATELYDEVFPRTAPNDWCGEFEPTKT